MITPIDRFVKTYVYVIMTPVKEPKFLPVNKQDMKERGWDACDVVFVTADAYCDHPSFGVALLSRLLEDEGYRVGIISQPDWRQDEDFLGLGAPRLFWGVTAGNLDSMLSIYTSQMNLRKEDKFAPGGIAGLRPKLPTIVYSNKVRQLFPGVPVVVGGIEASLRRLAHYDFWSDKVKRSILFDAKADILVYGMGERQVLEISRRLASGEKIGEMNDARGTVIARSGYGFLKDPVVLPSFKEVASDKKKFCGAFLGYSRHVNPFTARAVVQKTDTRYCVQLPPPSPLTQEEMDRVYGLKFTRRSHPSYDKRGGVPATKTIETSIVSHRGCGANCSFCSLSLHQGRLIQSRSKPSLVKEAEVIASGRNFKGVISDAGGPTANMYGAACRIKYQCAKEDCLWPEICPNFLLDPEKQLDVLAGISRVKGVKKVHIQSGVRYDLLLLPQARKFFKELCRSYTSGQLKIAPEHVSDKVLYLMRKPPHKTYEKFTEVFAALNKELGKDQYLTRYFITAHPGSDVKDARILAAYTKKMGHVPEQIQDFIPLPMTRSSVMYYTGFNPDTGKPLFVARKKSERLFQRRLIQGAK
jgi:uncharacterized radical SAM protein YgiQ